MERAKNIFWGLVVRPGKRYETEVQEAFRITKACLEPSTAGSKVSSVMVECDNSEEFIVANLGGKTLNETLDLAFNEGEKICFKVDGPGTVHMTGNILEDNSPDPNDSSMFDMMGGSEESSEEESDAEEIDAGDKIQEINDEEGKKAVEKILKRKKDSSEAVGASKKKPKVDESMEMDTTIDTSIGDLDDTENFAEENDSEEESEDDDDDDGEDDSEDEEVNTTNEPADTTNDVTAASEEDDDDDSDESDDEEEGPKEKPKEVIPVEETKVAEISDGKKEKVKIAEPALVKGDGDAPAEAKTVKTDKTPKKKVKEASLESKNPKDVKQEKVKEPKTPKETPAKESVEEKETTTEQVKAAEPKTPKQKKTEGKEGKTLKQEAKTPKQDVKPPKEEAKTPKPEAKTPKQEAKTPKQEAKTPKQEAKTPKQEAKTPKQDGKTPKPTDTPGKTPKRTVKGNVTLEDLKEGTGQECKPGNMVGMYYAGRLKKNSKQFDATLSGKPFKFKLGAGQVIKGWDVGVMGMKVGGKRRLTIPAPMGYGTSGAPPDIPPNADLVFDIECKFVK